MIAVKTLLLLMLLRHWQSGILTGLDYECWWLAVSVIGYYTIAVNCVGIAAALLRTLQIQVLFCSGQNNQKIITQQHNLLTLNK